MPKPTDDNAPLSDSASDRTDSWRWTVCGLLLLATMLNYMDRQTLSQTFPTIKKDLTVDESHYGKIEFGFGVAFAAGGLLFGFLVDRLGSRWLYPIVLIGWSAAGIATAHAVDVGQFLLSLFPGRFEPPDGMSQVDHAAYIGFLVCRVALGFFEAGQWPCALVTTQRILTRGDRTFGNSLLQSGASIGAILTPVIVSLSVDESKPETWRTPFIVIGCVGMLWTLPWLWFVRARDLRLNPAMLLKPAPAEKVEAAPSLGMREIVVRVAVLVVVVCTINMTWQFFRAWLPLFLDTTHGYSFSERNWFIFAYYIATDVGCIAVGFAVRALAKAGWSIHTARVATFTLCAGLTSLSVIAANLPRGPLLLGILLVIGFGALGLFPNYYSFTQEISKRHQGKVTGALGAITWTVTSLMQLSVGAHVKETGSYKEGIIFAGLAPVAACIVLWLFWRPGSKEQN